MPSKKKNLCELLDQGQALCKRYGMIAAFYFSSIAISFSLGRYYEEVKKEKEFNKLTTEQSKELLNQKEKYMNQKEEYVNKYLDLREKYMSERNTLQNENKR